MSEKSPKEKTFEILALSTHVAQTITGNVRGTINAIGAKVKMHFDGPNDPGYSGTSRGVWVVGDNTFKLVTYNNIQGVDVHVEGNPPILVARK